MSDAWFAASLEEIAAFLDKFEHQKSATVKADSDLVAALVGILSAGPAIYAMGKHAEAAYAAARTLDPLPVEDQ